MKLDPVRNSRLVRFVIGTAVVGGVILAPLGLKALGEGTSMPRMAVFGSALSFLRSRSPGERAVGELVSAKKVKKSNALTRRALARRAAVPKGTKKKHAPTGLKASISPTATALQGPAVFGDQALITALTPAAFELSELPVVGGLVEAPPASGGGIGSGIVPVAGGSGSGNGGGGDRLVAPVLPVSAVPEPGTWATMLSGFGAVGWSLRRRRRLMKRPESDPDLAGSSPS